jgi:nucleotidyltransferase substrate binding protein (TIGR01987 family)
MAKLCEAPPVILDLSSLRSAIAQAEEALAYGRSDLVRADARLALHLRAAAIQAFGFTYELAIKTLKRYLVESEPSSADIDAMSFNDLVRRGYAAGLLQAELAEWKEFRRNRGTTSHAYDTAKAQVIFDTIPAFLTEARFLLARIAERQASAP